MTLPQSVYNRWFHSYEEDSERALAYRPEEYPFPLSRGRSGFEIRPDGTFLELPIAPEDGTETVRGTWSEVGESRVRVSLENGRTYEMEFSAVEDERLGVRR